MCAERSLELPISLSSADGGVEVLHTGSMTAASAPTTILPKWTAVWWRISEIAVIFSACLATFFVLGHPGGFGVGLAEALGLFTVAVLDVGTVTVRGRSEPLLIFGLCNEGALA